MTPQTQRITFPVKIAHPFQCILYQLLLRFQLQSSKNKRAGLDYHIILSIPIPVSPIGNTHISFSPGRVGVVTRNLPIFELSEVVLICSRNSCMVFTLRPKWTSTSRIHTHPPLSKDEAWQKKWKRILQLAKTRRLCTAYFSSSHPLVVCSCKLYYSVRRLGLKCWWRISRMTDFHGKIANAYV